MSDQATLGEESEREDPSQQGTSYDEKQFVRRLLESCSNRTEETFNFEDYATQKERGLEDLHPKRRQKCYVNREDVLSDFVTKSKYRGRKTATHNLNVFESMVRGHHALAAGLHPSLGCGRRRGPPKAASSTHTLFPLQCIAGCGPTLCVVSNGTAQRH